MIAIQGVPVDTIETASSCSSTVGVESPTAVSDTVTASCAVGPGAHTSEKTGPESAAAVDTNTVQLLVDRMRESGERIDALIDPASVNRSWIRRGRVFWVQQRCAVGSKIRSSDGAAMPGTAREHNVWQQVRQHEHQPDLQHDLGEGPILSNVLSYDTVHPVELRFGFRRARYTLRCDTPCQDARSQCVSPPRTCAIPHATQCENDTETDVEDADAGGANIAESLAITENDRVVALAETWLATTSSK